MIRTLKGQLRFLDDFLLFSACVCLVAATILLNLGANILFQISIFRNMIGLAQQLPPKLVIDATSKIQLYTYPFGSLIWATIFFVKFSYLAFFRLLIDRQYSMLVYWRTTCLITGLAAVFDITSCFIGCPKFGNANIQCSNAYYMDRLLAVEAVTIALDIITDLMILSLPIYLLYQIKLKPRQKIGIGSFLCLSVFMIIIAIIRISRVHAADFEVWACFWQQIEGCVAVLMVSLTAFRTLFVGKHASASDQQKAKADSTYRRRLWFLKKPSQNGNGDGKVHVSVPVPGATMTGLRTFIRGEPESDDSLRTDESTEGLRDTKRPVYISEIIRVARDSDEWPSRADQVRPSASKS